uniref:Uncharacterized protein n=1 Tax=Oryza rufipogon TaxID=4529 RepID=A0A0E0QX65_ORYRU
MKCTLSQSNLTNKQLHDHSDEKKAFKVIFEWMCDGDLEYGPRWSSPIKRTMKIFKDRKLLQRSMPHAGAGAGSGAQMASVAVEDGWFSWCGDV